MSSLPRAKGRIDPHKEFAPQETQQKHFDHRVFVSVSVQLIDSFAWEIGTLKKVMGKNTEPVGGDQKTETLVGWAHAVSVLKTVPKLCVRLCLYIFRFLLVYFSMAASRERS